MLPAAIYLNDISLRCILRDARSAPALPRALAATFLGPTAFSRSRKTLPRLSGLAFCRVWQTQRLRNLADGVYRSVASLRGGEQTHKIVSKLHVSRGKWRRKCPICFRGPKDSQIRIREVRYNKLALRFPTRIFVKVGIATVSSLGKINAHHGGFLLVHVHQISSSWKLSKQLAWNINEA